MASAGAIGPYGTDTANSTRYTEQANCFGAGCDTVSHLISQWDSTTVAYTGATWEAQNGSLETLAFAREETYIDFHDQQSGGDDPHRIFTKTVSYAYSWDLFSPAPAGPETNTGSDPVSKPYPSGARYSLGGSFHEDGWLMVFTSFTQGGSTEISAVSEYGLSESELQANPTSFGANSTLSGLLSSGDYSLSPSYYK